MNAKSNSIRKVLLAVDGSDHSRAAVQTVQDLDMVSTNYPDCRVMILGALPHSQGYNHTAYLYPLQLAQKMLGDQGIQANFELILGYPADVILEYAAKNQPELIVIGAKGLRSTLGILLGGVAQRVVEYAKCPVLVIRAPYRNIKHVLVVTDGSEHSRDAVDYAANFPLQPKPVFHLLHVLPPSAILTPETLARVWSSSDDLIDLPVFSSQEFEAEAENARILGQAILDEAGQILVSHNIQAKNTLLRGDAATEILQYARDEKIDLIVVGSRGLSQVQSWLVGSVSRKLVHYAECSVMLVKRPSNTPE